MKNPAIKCDEVKESYDEETVTISTNCNEKDATSKTQKCFNCIFMNCYSIIAVVIIIILVITY